MIRRKMKTTWSVNDIKVKDNFYDFYKNDVCRQLLASSSQLKAPYHCSSKPCIIRGRSLQWKNDKRTDLWEVFVVGGNVFVKDCSGEMNCGTKVYAIVRGKKGLGGYDLFFHCFYCGLSFKNSTIASTYFSDMESS